MSDPGTNLEENLRFSNFVLILSTHSKASSYVSLSSSALRVDLDLDQIKI